MDQKELGVLSPIRVGDSEVAQGPRTSRRNHEMRRHLSFVGDPDIRGAYCPTPGINHFSEAAGQPSRSSLYARSSRHPTYDRNFQERPALLPMKFDGQTAWQDFKVHFEMIADLNNWDEVQKSTYLAVRLKTLSQNWMTYLGKIQKRI